MTCPLSRCNANSDIYGDHAVSCAAGSERIAKHNHVRDAIFCAAQQANLGPVREPDGLLPGSDDRPADILIPYRSQGRDTAFDITVVNSLQSSLVSRVAEEGSHAVNYAYKNKQNKYQDRCNAEGLKFVPLAVDTFSSWQKDSLSNLKKLGRQLARAVGKEESEVVRHFRQRVAVLLVRDNVAMLHGRAPSLPPSHVDGDTDNVGE